MYNESEMHLFNPVIQIGSTKEHQPQLMLYDSCNEF